MKKNNSGITLVALIITIIVMIIIATISLYEGKEIIQKSKVQTIQTNMFSIQAKVKAYAEEIDAKVWALSNKEEKRKSEFNNRGLNGPNSNEGKLEYTITQDALKKMGLETLNASDYTVVFNTSYTDIDIKYNPGIKYKNVTYTTLSGLEEVLNNE